MNAHIEHLTSTLIRKHRLDIFAEQVESWDVFIKLVKERLEQNDVRAMSPKKLGIIMCSLEIGDVMAGKQELLSHAFFGGDCGDLLRSLVAACLAYVIKERLIPENPAPYSVAPYDPTQYGERHL